MLSTTEVAKQMGVAYTTVMLWIKQGKLDAVKQEHPRGDYYEVSPAALKKLDRGRKGRPSKKAEGEGEADLPAVTAAEMKAGDVVKTPVKSKTTKKRAAKKVSK